MNPFADLEKILLDPPASGLCALRVSESSVAGRAGLVQGDIIAAVDGESFADRPSFYAMVRPGASGPAKHDFEVRRAGGGVETLRFDSWPVSFQHCLVRKGEAAWQSVPDTDAEPDFSALQGEIWLRNSFGDEPAGFEALFLEPRGDELLVKSLFHIGGDGENPWDYRTRGESLHRLERGLPVVATAFWEGAPDAEALRGDVELRNGKWSGRRGTAEGGTSDVSYPSDAPTCTAYAATLLPLTMPLAEGASLTFFLTGDGYGRPTARSRMECLGKRETTLGGEGARAWCFAWRHWGARRDEEDEKFWVSDDRRLLRIDWGPDSGDCWCEAVEDRDSLGKLPVPVA